MSDTDSSLALLGGSKAVRTEAPDLFKWPIVTLEDEQAVLDVLRRGAMSGRDVTTQFEQEFAAWFRVGPDDTLVFRDGWWYVQRGPQP